MRIGIIGAGPSGSYAAYQLARAGFEVLLFDKYEAREKPCGGGVTYKALSSFPLITASPVPRTFITRLRVIDPAYKTVDLHLDRPLSIFSRREMDYYINLSARKAGAQFFPTRVVDLTTDGSGWRLRTTDAEHRVDFLVGADGAKSLVRAKFVGPFGKRDLATTAGYYVPGCYHSDVIICQFLGRGFRGYLWSFPRHDHLSVGIISDLTRAQSPVMREHVRRFIRQTYPEAVVGPEQFYSAVAPEVHYASWPTLPFSGDRWALIGDAAGFVDPVTGEGIYYAMRSAELLSAALIQGNLRDYRDACRKEFIEEFIRASRWKYRLGDYYSLIARVLIGSRHSSVLQTLQNEFVAGTLTYRTMRAALLKKSPFILREVLMDKLRSLI